VEEELATAVGLAGFSALAGADHQPRLRRLAKLRKVMTVVVFIVISKGIKGSGTS
jgi:hypothetical protein